MAYTSHVPTFTRIHPFINRLPEQFGGTHKPWAGINLHNCWQLILLATLIPGGWHWVVQRQHWVCHHGWRMRQTGGGQGSVQV